MAEKMKIKVDRDTKRRLLEVIKKDSEFFAKAGIIDYSILIGVHYRARPK